MIKQKASQLEPWSATHRDIYEDGTVKYYRGPIEFLPNRIQFFPDHELGYGKKHHHRNVEMIYVYQGTMTALLEDKSIPLSAGDLVIFNANSLHGTLIEQHVDFLCIILDTHFAAEYGFSITDTIFQNVIKQNQNIKEICSQIVSEVTKKRSCTLLAQTLYCIPW